MLPPFRRARVMPNIPYSLYHPLLDLGLELIAASDCPEIVSLSPSAHPGRIWLQHRGGDEGRAFLSVLLSGMGTRDLFDLVPIPVPEDLPF